MKDSTRLFMEIVLGQLEERRLQPSQYEKESLLLLEEDLDKQELIELIKLEWVDRVPDDFDIDILD